MENFGNGKHAPLAVSVTEATEMLPIGKTKIRALIAAGVIRSHFIGKKRLIPIAEIRALANGDIQA